MTNEELVARIQNGEGDKLQELWEAARRFVLKQALGRVERLEGRRGVDVDDLMQAGFIALMDAANNFDASAGVAFLTWYGFKLKTAFQEAAGCRTKRQMMELIDQAVSLETPLTDEEDAALLGDTIPDPEAERAFDAVAEGDRARHLHNALESALATLPPEEADALRAKFFKGEPANTKACQRGMRLLRHPNISRDLREFL